MTARNDIGELPAEPDPVRISRAAPVVVDMLADLSIVQGAVAVEVAAAAAFAGEGLRFAATGAGAVIDPATGVLRLPTDALRDGETVTVTATNSGGTVEASFLVTIKVAPPVPVPPVLLAVPVLAGTARIGSELRVETGSWGGWPVPALALQWLRDGAAINGATAAAYTVTPADDRCALACRVTGQNSAGSHSGTTAALTATYAAPTRSGELFDEILDQAPGAETVATAQAFTGENLRFAVTGGRAVIDPATGVLSIPTDTVVSGETVTVTATNSGGAASAAFLLTIEADTPEIPDFPAPLADTAWSAAEIRDVAPAGRRQVTIAAGVVPAGYELCLYSGAADGRENAAWRKAVKAGESYTTGSSMAVGATCLNLLFWRRVADGTWASPRTRGCSPSTDWRPDR